MSDNKNGFKFIIAIAMLFLSTFAGAITLRVGSLSTDSIETRTTAAENVLINFLNRVDLKIKRPAINLATFSVQYMDLFVEDAVWSGGTALSPKIHLKGNLKWENLPSPITGKWGPKNHQNKKIVRATGPISAMMMDDYDEYAMETDFWDEYYNADGYYSSLIPSMEPTAACIASYEMGYVQASGYCRRLYSNAARGVCWAAAAAVYGACLASC